MRIPRVQGLLLLEADAGFPSFEDEDPDDAQWYPQSDPTPTVPTDCDGQLGLFDSGSLVRTAIERMHRIAELLRLGRPVNSTILMRRFEVSRKTIVRDIEFMRDRLRWDIEFDPRRNSYFLRTAPRPVL